MNMLADTSIASREELQNILQHGPDKVGYLYYPDDSLEIFIMHIIHVCFFQI